MIACIVPTEGYNGCMAKKHHHMRKRLSLMAVQAAQLGRQATVAQISATYATMATGDYDDELWAQLLTLAKAARPVTDDCYHCKNGHVSGFVPGIGFVWKECPRCQGTKLVQVHKPQPGDLDEHTMGKQFAELAKRLGTPCLMQQVADALQHLVTKCAFGGSTAAGVKRRRPQQAADKLLFGAAYFEPDLVFCWANGRAA